MVLLSSVYCLGLDRPLHRLSACALWIIHCSMQRLPPWHELGEAMRAFTTRARFVPCAILLQYVYRAIRRRAFPHIQNHHHELLITPYANANFITRRLSMWIYSWWTRPPSGNTGAGERLCRATSALYVQVHLLCLFPPGLAMAAIMVGLSSSTPFVALSLKAIFLCFRVLTFQLARIFISEPNMRVRLLLHLPCSKIHLYYCRDQVHI